MEKKLSSNDTQLGQVKGDILVKKISNYEKIINYGADIANATIIKNIVYAILGGLFLGFGNLAYQVIKSYHYFSENQALLTILASSLFPMGFLLTSFVGATIFTSATLVIGAVIEKKTTWNKALNSLGIMFIGNWFGAFVFAAMVRMSGLYSSAQMLAYLGELSSAKANLDWYKVIFQGMITNIIVVVIIMGCYGTDNGAAKFLITQLFVTIFAILGTQHLVANFYTFNIALLYSGQDLLENAGIKESWPLEVKDEIKHNIIKLQEFDFAKAFYNNLLLAMVGHLFITTVYIYTYKFANDNLEVKNSKKA
jgi:nitrite transporter